MKLHSDWSTRHTLQAEGVVEEKEQMVSRCSNKLNSQPK